MKWHSTKHLLPAKDELCLVKGLEFIAECKYIDSPYWLFKCGGNVWYWEEYDACYSTKEFSLWAYYDEVLEEIEE